MTSPFDNLAGKATNASDSLGQGAFPAPKGAPDDLFLKAAGSITRQALQAGGGLPTINAQDVTAEEQQSMSMFDKILHKKKWFAGKIGIPNPVKAALDGLAWYQSTVVDPLVGMAAAQFSGNKGIYEDTVGQARGGWDKWQAFGDLNRQREDNTGTLNLGFFDLTISEKFISSMVGDPLTYVGWGFLGKVPLVGRALGPMESQFIKFTNKPFELGSKMYKKAPTLLGLPERSRGQVARAAGDRAATTWDQYAMEKLGKPSNRLTIEETDMLVGAALDLEHNLYGELPEAARAFRDIFLERPLMSDGELTNLVRGGNRTMEAAGGEAFDIATLGLENLPIGVRKSVTDIIESATSGRLSNAGVGASEVSDYIVSTLGLPHNAEFQQGIMEQVSKLVSDQHTGLKQLSTNLTPKSLRNSVVVKARNIARVNSEFGFDDWANRTGFFGGAVQQMDTTLNSMYRNGLQKWFVNPSQKYILSFLGFPLSEAPESITRQWLGKSTHGWMDSDKFAVKYSQHEGLTDLIDNASNMPAFTRGGEAIEAGDVGFKEYFGAVGVDIPEHIFKKMDVVFGRGALDLTNTMAGLARRHYIDYRFLQEAMPLIDEKFPAVAKVIKELPEELGPWRDEIQNELVTRVMSGSDFILDDLVNLKLDTSLLPDTFMSNKLSILKDKPVIGRIIADRQKRELRKTADRFIQGNGWTRETGELVHSWIDSGSSLRDLTENVIPSMKTLQTKEFLNSPKAAVESMEIILAVAKQAPVGNIAAADNVVRYANKVMDDLQMSAHQIASNATVSARSIRNGTDAQFKMFDDATKAIDEGTRALNKIAGELRERLAELTPGTNTAVIFQSKIDLVSRTIGGDRADVASFIASWGNKTKNDKFFKELYAIRDNHFSGMAADFAKLNADQTKAITGFNPSSNKYTSEIERQIAPKDFSKKRMDEGDIAYILGSTPEATTQAVLSPVFSTKEDFVTMVSDAVKYREGLFTGVTDEQIGKAYERITKQYGQTGSSLSFSTKQEVLMESFKDELAMEAIGPKFNLPQEKALREGVEKAKAAMADSKDELIASGKDTMDTVMKDYKRQFIDYDDQTILDDFMKSIFPFWTYESRRPGFLLRTMLQNPAAANAFGPDGRYWQATGDGYMNTNIGGFDVNPLSGGVFGSLRRTYKSEFPNTGSAGLAGGMNRAEETMARMGFYPGSHIQMLTNGVLPFIQGEEAQLGELAPPPFSAGLGALEAIGFTPASTMRKTLFRDRFHQYTVSRVLWDMKLNPSEVDFETWEPKPGATVTQDDIAKALRKAGLIAFVTEQAGIVRYRGDEEREFRASKDGLLSQYTGLTQDDIDTSRRQGRNPLAGVQLSPQQRRMLNELPGNEEFLASVSRIGEGEKRKREDHGAEMWTTYKQQVSVFTDEQEDDDLLLLSGQIDPLTWRNNRTDRGKRQSNILPALRGKYYENGLTVDTDLNAPYADVPVTEMEYLAQARELGIESFQGQHPVSEYVHTYNSIQPQDMDGDGIVEWDSYFKRRKEYLENEVDPAWLPLVHEEISRNDTTLELEMRRMSEGSLGDYWNINRDVKEEMDLGEFIKLLETEQRLGNTQEAEALAKDTRYRRYIKEVRRRRNLLRRDDAQLDYALNVFGFTGKRRSFQNIEAEAYWNANGASLGFFK